MFIVSYAGNGQHFIIQTNWGSPMMPPASWSASHYLETELAAPQSGAEARCLLHLPAEVSGRAGLLQGGCLGRLFGKRCWVIWSSKEGRCLLGALQRGRTNRVCVSVFV